MAPVHAAEYPDPPFDFAAVPFPGRPLFNPIDGIRPVDTLVVFIRFDGLDYTGVDAAFLAGQVFDFSGPSFSQFLRIWSNGSAFLSPAQDSNAAFGGAANDGIVIVEGGDANTRALTSEQKRRLGLDLANPFIDYSRYDTNGDGRIDNRELAILVITGDGSDDRQEGGQDGSVDDSGRELDGVNFAGRTVALAGGGSSLKTRLHEFIHQAYTHVDLYGYGIGQWDIMGGDGQGASSFTKLMLGWATPRIVSRDGWYTLRRSDRNEDLLLLYDPDHGTHEYFLVENRIPDGTGLSGAPDSGLYIQRVNSDFWGSRHSSEPIAETIRPDGMPINPACTEFSVLAEDADIGDRTIRLVQNYFGFLTPPFEVVLAREGESDREEIVTITSMEDMDDSELDLESPLTLAHAAGTEVKWTRIGFDTYFATELAEDFDSGNRVLTVGRVAGNVPATPFDAALGDTRVTINDISDALWTMDEAINSDLDAGTSLRSLWRVDCNGSSDTDAWDTADAGTERFDRFEATWGDGFPARVSLLAVGPAAETTEVYVDVPANERAFYLQRTDVIRIAGSLVEAGTSPDVPWELRNTGSESDSYRVQLVDRDARVWLMEGPSLNPGESEILLLPKRAPVSSPPDGLEVMYRVESMIDPTVFEDGTIPVDWPFREQRSDSAQVTEWTGNEPDQRIFAPLTAGSGIIRSTSADFDGIAQFGDFYFRLPFATISPLDDSDDVVVELPDLASELLPLLDLPTGQPVPTTVNDCGQLGIIELPGPFGPETIELRSVLEATVIPRNNFRPPADDLRPSIPPRGPTEPYSLSVRLDCPYSRFREADTRGNPVRLILAAGRERLQRYAYEVEVQYKVHLLRVPGDSIYRDLADEDGRGIPCPGGFFPICEADAFGRFATPLPTPRLKPPGCPADGCPDHFVFAWQGGDALDLNFLAPALTQIALLDAFGTRIREALPAKPADFLDEPFVNETTVGSPAAAAVAARLTPAPEMVAMNSPPPISPEDPPPPPPSPFETDPPTLPPPVAYSMEMINVPQGLYFLQVTLPPDHDPAIDSAPVTISWQPTDPDGDSVPPGMDNCPYTFNPNQSDFDQDGLGDACDGDDDGDFVADAADRCPGTVIPEPVPLSGVLEENNWALHRNDGVFTQAAPQTGSTVPFTTTRTKGCSCGQIVVAAALGTGHLDNGCSTGVMKNWSTQN